MNTYIIVSIIVAVIGFISLAFAIVIMRIRTLRREHFISHFVEYQAATTYYLEKAFDLIYKDRIMIFSIEATRPDKKEFDVISKDFCKLFIKLLGPTLYEELIHFNGDDDTLILSATEYFNNRSEHDEIKETSINQLMENDTIK